MMDMLKFDEGKFALIFTLVIANIIIWHSALSI
jgi:hypothetical protein